MISVIKRHNRKTKTTTWKPITIQCEDMSSEDNLTLMNQHY